MTTTNKTTKQPTWGPTKNGIRKHNASGFYYINAKLHGKVINESTGQKELRAALDAKNTRLDELAPMIQAREVSRVTKDSTLGALVERFNTRINTREISKQWIDNQMFCLRLITDHWPKVIGPDKKAFGKRFEDCHAEDIDLLMLECWRGHLVSAGLSAGYINRTIRIVKALFEDAVDIGMISDRKNPTRKFKNAKGKAKRKKIHSLAAMETILHHLDGGRTLARTIKQNYPKGTQTNWQRAFEEHPEWRMMLAGKCDMGNELAFRGRLSYLLESADTVAQHQRDFVEGLAFSGLRKGEANRLKVKHVRLDRQELDINEEVAEKVSESSGIGTVPINHPRVFALFSRLCADKGPEDFVFEVKGCNRALRRACEAAKVDVLTHHGMRHFAASWWYWLTKDMKLVKEYLRHAPDSELAETLYTHNFAEGREEGRAAMAGNVIPLAQPDALKAAATLSPEVLRQLLAQAEARNAA